MGRFGDFDSIPHDDIIRAFLRNVPGTYVRDYRDNGGYIVICKDYRDIKWGRSGTTTEKVARQIPAVTLVNLPQGNVTKASRYHGFKLDRPGWKHEFRKAAIYLTPDQRRRITKALKRDQVFFEPFGDAR
jgi:hypothetical protein